MSDQPTENNAQPEPYNRHDERMKRIEERRARRGGGSWVGGVALIILGVVFWLQNMGTLNLRNWWALFILIPAVGAFSNAWWAYQDSGRRLTSRVRGALIGGVVFSLITAIFLFDLNWGYLGPIIIILAGVGILLNAMLPRD